MHEEICRVLLSLEVSTILFYALWLHYIFLTFWTYCVKNLHVSVSVHSNFALNSKLLMIIKPLIFLPVSHKFAQHTIPKIRFPTPTKKRHFLTLPTHVFQRIGRNFMKMNEMCQKCCPVLQTSYIMKSNFSSSGSMGGKAIKYAMIEICCL